MQNNDKKYFIPVDGTPIEVSEDVYRAYYQPIWNTRYHAQQNGECRCTKAQLWKCDGICPGCPFYAAGKKVSIDTPIGGEDDELTLGDTLADDAPSAESILMDKKLLDALYDELNRLDPDGRRGLSAIGKVCVEGLIIAYGEGRNGKSTFWNTLSRVMGTYSGNMSADTLTVGCKRNVKPELAEAKGKRIIIAAELEEGMRLNTSNVKQLCSTDEIYAEKKYKDPFSFVPSHTLVLYTNHLPKVGAIDAGTWRRLIVIPFNAKIEGSSDIKNYADYLFNKAGGAILKWIMTGAKRVIEKDYHIVKPAVVEAAIQKYKDNNDWLSQFLDECCETDSSYSAKSGDVYNAYRSYCMQVGDYIRSTTDFYTALECAGFERKRSKSARLLFGLQLTTWDRTTTSW